MQNSRKEKQIVYYIMRVYLLRTTLYACASCVHWGHRLSGGKAHTLTPADTSKVSHVRRNRGSGPGVFKLSVDVGGSRDSFRVQSFVDVHKHKPTGEKKKRKRESQSLVLP